VLSTIVNVEYVDNTKHWSLFIVADSRVETQSICECSHRSHSVVNNLVWLKYVDNSKRRLCLYQPTGTPKRAEQNSCVDIGKSEAE